MKKAELRDIHKTFESVPDETGTVQRFTALDGVSLSFRAGEIHTIIGENGAGKSTLVNILSGLHQPSRGCVRIGSQEFCFASPSEALSAGIAMVHQRPLLSDDLSVLENILIGTAGFFLRRERNTKIIEEIKQKWNIKIDLSSPAKKLNAAGRLQTALLGSLFRKPDFLILDEPTSVLSPEERELFFEAMKRECSKGLGIILITHKMNEAVRVSDRISILKQGKLIYSSEVRGGKDSPPVTEQFLSSLINPELTGMHTSQTQQISQAQYKPKPPTVHVLPEAQLSAHTFEIENITARPLKRNPVHRLSFSALPGKITGIFGLPASGIETLEDILSGLLQADEGTFIIAGKKFNARQTDSALLRKNGIAFVPSDRTFRASHPDITIFDMLTVYRTGRAFLPLRENRAYAKALLREEDLDLQTGRKAGTLSGGQLQRLILARELSLKPDILILAEPDWGLDIKSTALLRERLLAASNSGMTIIILTDNPDSIDDRNFYAQTFVLREGFLS